MKIQILASLLLAAALHTSSAAGQSARDVVGVSPYEDVPNEPAPTLVIDPPFEAPLAFGVFQAQYRVENLRIAPIFGEGGLKVSPRIGHLHVIVDDLPWWWAEASPTNTIDVANLPPGPHKVTIRLVNPNHQVFPGQVATWEFTIPERTRAEH